MTCQANPRTKACFLINTYDTSQISELRHQAWQAPHQHRYCIASRSWGAFLAESTDQVRHADHGAHLARQGCTAYPHLSAQTWL